MKLELIRTKEQHEENVIIKKSVYKLDGYSVYKLDGYYDVFVTKVINVSEKLSYKIISVSADFEKRTKNYLPEIYFNESKSQFEIQTTSWGAMDVNEIKKVVAGYNTAIEAVATLTATLL